MRTGTATLPNTTRRRQHPRRGRSAQQRAGRDHQHGRGTAEVERGRVDPSKHVLDIDTGLTATGSDNRGPGPSSEPLKQGEKPTLGHYTLEAAAVGARTPAVAAEEAAQEARNKVLQENAGKH